MIKSIISWLKRKLPYSVYLKLETKEEFLAEVERHNQKHKESVRRANQKMQQKYEAKWVDQFIKEKERLL